MHDAVWLRDMMASLTPRNAPHERRGHSRLGLAVYGARGAPCGC